MNGCEPHENYRVPKLHELLKLVAETNQQRMTEGKPSFHFNLELKGQKSATASLAAVIELNRSQRQADPQAQAPTIDCKDIVWLGRLNTYEIIIVKILSQEYGSYLQSSKFQASDPRLSFEVFLRTNCKSLIDTIKHEALQWKIQHESLESYQHGQDSEETIAQYQKVEDFLMKISTQLRIKVKEKKSG